MAPQLVSSALSASLQEPLALPSPTSAIPTLGPATQTQIARLWQALALATHASLIQVWAAQTVSKWLHYPASPLYRSMVAAVSPYSHMMHIIHLPIHPAVAASLKLLCHAATLCLNNKDYGTYGPGSCPNGDNTAQACDPAADPATATAIAQRGFSGILTASGGTVRCTADSDCAAGAFCDGSDAPTVSLCVSYSVC